MDERKPVKNGAWARLYKKFTNPRALPGELGALAAFAILFAHPLIYQDYYFNINRFKFAVYCYGSFSLFIAYLGLCAVRRSALSGSAYPPFRVSLADAGMIALLLCALISCVLSEDPFSAFTGDEGRFSGLVFMLALGAAYAVLSRAPRARAFGVRGLLASGALASLLGIVNFFELDPLGFTRRLSDKNAQAFISTIGNIDFFGAFLCLVLPAAAAMAISGGKIAFLLCAPVCALGAGAVIAARTEGALFAVAAAVFASLLLGAPSRARRGRMCAVLACVLWGFSAVGALCAWLPNGHLSVDGSAGRVLIQSPAAVSLLALALSGAGYALLKSPQKAFPGGGRAWRRAVVSVALAALFAAMLAFAYFTWIDTQTELPGSWSLLRFRDKWGSNRGGVWLRCLRLYAGAGPRVWLFGFGEDCLKAPLAAAYGQEIIDYCNLSFDNAHNEAIQYLLTLGALGLLSYALFAAGALFSMLREKTPASRAALAAACGYLLHGFVNVNQPITTPLLFALLSCGAALSRNRKNDGGAYDA